MIKYDILVYTWLHLWLDVNGCRCCVELYISVLSVVIVGRLNILWYGIVVACWYQLTTGKLHWWIIKTTTCWWEYIDCLVEDCSISIANALELLRSCTKPSICIINDKICSRFGYVWFCGYIISSWTDEFVIRLYVPIFIRVASEALNPSCDDFLCISEAILKCVANIHY